MTFLLEIGIHGGVWGEEFPRQSRKFNREFRTLSNRQLLLPTRGRANKNRIWNFSYLCLSAVNLLLVLLRPRFFHFIFPIVCWCCKFDTLKFYDRLTVIVVARTYGNTQTRFNALRRRTITTIRLTARWIEYLSPRTAINRTWRGLTPWNDGIGIKPFNLVILQSQCRGISRWAWELSAGSLTLQVKGVSVELNGNVAASEENWRVERKASGDGYLFLWLRWSQLAIYKDCD